MIFQNGTKRMHAQARKYDTVTSTLIAACTVDTFVPRACDGIGTTESEAMEGSISTLSLSTESEAMEGSINTLSMSTEAKETSEFGGSGGGSGVSSFLVATVGNQISWIIPRGLGFCLAQKIPIHVAKTDIPRRHVGLCGGGLFCWCRCCLLVCFVGVVVAYCRCIAVIL